MNRIDIINYLERKFPKIYHGGAINLGQTTDKICDLIDNGKSIEDIEIYQEKKFDNGNLILTIK